MPVKVAAVRIDGDVQNRYAHALNLIGCIDDLTTVERRVVVKLGVFSPRTGIHTTVDTVKAIASSFSRSQRIFLVESDNSAGEALKRLEIWSEVGDDRVVPFNLSTDPETVDATIVDEKVAFSHLLFKPNVFVSTHVARRYEDAGADDMMNLGSILKNLLGLIPDVKKYRFHNKIATALLDIYEAIGGIDLAVLDGTYTFMGRKKKRIAPKTNFLLVGRDAIAVDTVASQVVGLDPEKNPVIQEAAKRGLGETDIDNIDLLGIPLKKLRQEVIQSFKELFPKKIQRTRRWL